MTSPFSKEEIVALGGGESSQKGDIRNLFDSVVGCDRHRRQKGRRRERGRGEGAEGRERGRRGQGRDSIQTAQGETQE